MKTPLDSIQNRAYIPDKILCHPFAHDINATAVSDSIFLLSIRSHVYERHQKATYKERLQSGPPFSNY